MKIDLHCHLNQKKLPFFSGMRPECVIKIAKKRGMNGLAAIADNSLRSYFALKNSINNDKDFVLIPGFEYIGFEIPEILVLGIDFVPMKKMMLDFIDEVRDNDGVCVLPHPFTVSP